MPKSPDTILETIVDIENIWETESELEFNFTDFFPRLPIERIFSKILECYFITDFEKTKKKDYRNDLLGILKVATLFSWKNIFRNSQKIGKNLFDRNRLDYHLFIIKNFQKYL